MQIKINLWNPHPNQKKLVEDKARFKVVICGRQFGKTTYAVNTLIKAALIKKNGTFFYVAPTYRQAKAIAWKLLHETVTRLPKELVHKVNESELFVVIGNNTTIAIKGADTPDSLRGVPLDGAVLDEYADMKPNVFEEIISKSFLVTKGWCIFIGTPKGFNHFYELYTQAQNWPDWSTFHFTSYDNPYADKAYLESEKERTSPETFSQEYMAEFTKHSGLVYKDFDRTRHIYKEIPEGRRVQEVIAGVDFGFDHPAIILTIRRDYYDCYWIEDEWVQTGKTPDEHMEAAKQKKREFSINAFYPDGARPELVTQWQRNGLYCRPVSKDVEAGIGTVINLLRTDKLKVKSTCYQTIKEFESYSKDKLGRIIKEEDDCMDALRYALYNNHPTLEEETPYHEINYDPYS